jgi:WD40 repeat protein/serine/threonine protein kinase
MDQLDLLAAPPLVSDAGKRFMEQAKLHPPLKFPGPPTEDAPLGKLFHYRIMEPIGSGGFGSVFRAYDEELCRDVAIKVLVPKGGNFDIWEEHNNRFQREARAMSQLSNDHIVRVHRVGTFESQTYPGIAIPFIEMELMKGGDLESCVQRQPLQPRVAASIVQQVACGLAAAHGINIIHRDLKPSNLLLDFPSLQSRVKIADFLAKDIGAVGATRTMVVGTPAYMSPEQQKPDSKLDHRTDIYSLGVILYELLTARLPPAERAVPPPQNGWLGWPTDLRTIATKCLEELPQDRYLTATALAEDLQCFCNNEPISATPPSWIKAQVKWLRRNPLWAAVWLFAILTTIASIPVLTYLNLEMRHAKLKIQAESQLAVTARLDAEDRERTANRFRYAYLIKLAQSDLASENVMGTIRRLRELVPKAMEEDLRSFEWNYLWNECSDGYTAYTLEGEVRAIDVSPDRQWVGAVTAAGQIWLRNLRDGTERQFGSHQGRVMWIAFRKDGTTLLTATGHRTNRQDGPENEIKLWEIATGTELQRWTSSAAPICCYALSPDDRTLAMAFDRHRVRLFDLVDAQDRSTFAVHEAGQEWAASLAFSPDGRQLAVGTINGRVLLRDTMESREIARGKEHVGPVFCIGYSPDGTTIASAAYDKQILLWGDQLKSQMLLGRIQGQPLSLAFGSNGELAIVDNNRAARVWYLRSGRTPELFQSQDYQLQSVYLAVDSKQLFGGGRTEQDVGGKRGGILVWQLDQRPRCELQGHSHWLQSLSFSRDGRQVVSGSVDRSVRVWDVASGKETALLEGHSNTVHAVTFLDAGQRVASVGTGRKQGARETHGELFVWDVQTHLLIREPFHCPHSLFSVAVSADGRWLSAGDEVGAIRVWNTETWQMEEWRLDRPLEIRSLAFSPTESLLAVGDQSGRVQLVRWPEQEVTEVCPGGTETNNIWSLAFSPDGKRLAASHSDMAARVWDVTSHALTHEFRSPGGMIRGVAFTSDGKCLVTTRRNQVVLWDLNTQDVRFTMEATAPEIWAVAVDPAGGAIAAGGEADSVTLWRAAPH